MTNKLKTGTLPLVKPLVPPLEDFLPYLNRIWESRQLTNGGPVHAEFEKALCEYLGVKNICLFANGTLGLMIALKALKLRGEVITTPFTSLATLQAICWNNLVPVFVDINETTLNIEAPAIEAAITSRTCAILPVHIFGTPCNVDTINQLAKKYTLKVIYDAAHCFGVGINGESICNFGDLSVLSFHATKVFNTIEGGAIVCHDEKTKKTIEDLKNNGVEPDYKHNRFGINAKMNEIQSAFGLCQLKYVDEVIAARRAATLKYRELLSNLKGLRVFHDVKGVRHNYSYFPVIINPGEFGTDRDELSDHLKKKNIITRKYFYPLVSDYPEFELHNPGNLPIAQKTAKNILCIPLFHDITDEQIKSNVNLIIQLHRGKTGNHA